MNVLLSMSLGGSILILAYMAVKALRKKDMSLQSRWSFLLAASCFFLLPYPKLKYRYLFGFWGDFLGIDVFGWISRWIDDRNTSFYVISNNYGDILYRKDERIILLFFLAVGFFLVFGRQCYLMQKYKKRIMKQEKKEETRKIGIQRVRIIQSKEIIAPGAVGIFRPIIMLPDIREDERELVLRHEVQHIRAGDLFLNCLEVVLLSMHWFNPFIYYLLNELQHVQELRCDQKATRNMSDNEREQYVDLLFRFAREQIEKTPFLSELSGGGKRMKERAEIVLLKRQNKCSNKIVGVMALMFSILLSSFTVLAYVPAREYEIEEADSVEAAIDLTENGEFFEEEDFSDLVTVYPLIWEVKSVYKGEDGGVFYYDEGNAFMSTSCNHSFVNGIFRSHAMEGIRCVVQTYEAKRCRECPYVKIGRLIRTVGAQPCPHQR